MKIAAIALASALASLAFAQPSLAQTESQTDHDQAGQMQYGQGSQNQFRGGMNRDRETYGQGENWRRDDNGRGPDNDQWHGGWRRDGSGMEGRMGPMGPRMHDRFGEGRGASFSFGNGRARMAVQCPANESVETCVRAASQLLDKITSLRSGGAGTTSGAGVGSGSNDNSTVTPQLNQGNRKDGSSGTQNEDEQ